ncbi:nicotinate (nicotinamide) nucleotide adenylyltransferase [Phormidium tenue FACHB-886]|nr:nicotinate (nicotinamide) nucleotide adenylyltransferase [Phormidium tenue FACHB-886]
MSKKIAVLGGTFNPVHIGHLIMAETALNQCALDCVLWVPTHRPIYKSTAGLVEFKHRLEMLKLAIAAHPQFEASAIEQTHSISYAIETLLALQALHPDNQWYWIVGLDAAQSLPHWHRRQELVPQCIWLIAPRQLHSSATNQVKPCQQVAEKLLSEEIMFRWEMLEMPLVEISSGLIRHYCTEQRSIRYLLPDAVKAYIQTLGLYRSPD